MRHALIAALVVVTLAGCKQAPPTPGPVEVVVDTAIQKTWRRETVFVGRLAAAEDVAIRTKVSGYLKEKAFREGDEVKAGDLLFRIDPAPVEAEVRKAEAALKQAESARSLAQANMKRGQEVFDKGAISASELDKLKGAMNDAEANLAAVKAQLDGARLNLGYTEVRAPVSGRIGASKASVGDLVGPDSGGLVTLVTVDPIRVEFQVSEVVFLNALKKRREYEARGETPPPLHVSVEQSNGERYGREGVIDYIDNRINETTATLTVKASVPNPEGQLVVGQYVRVHVPAPQEESVIMIPQAALQSDQQGMFVLEVDADNKVKRRNVTVGDRVEDRVIVIGGLAEGARLIVRGVQKVKTGQTVNVKALPPQA
jgi:membrane fusion protein (multidrug efflux system)